jgi:hypothetical protein
MQRIQFRTETTKQYTRLQWSDDYGQTWQEPEAARDPVVVAAWQRIAALSQAIAQDARTRASRAASQWRGRR